jgi:hypothetical protein
MSPPHCVPWSLFSKDFGAKVLDGGAPLPRAACLEGGGFLYITCMGSEADVATFQVSVNDILADTFQTSRGSPLRLPLSEDAMGQVRIKALSSVVCCFSTARY